MTTQQGEDSRGRGRVLRGRVTSNKMERTISVEVARRVRHPRYNKYVQVKKRYHAHDEHNSCEIGDLVDIVEAAPKSKIKRWRLRAIVEKVQK